MAQLAFKLRCASLLPVLALLLGVAGISWHPPDQPRKSRLVDPPTNNIIRTEVGYSPEELVRNVFVAGTCDNITQIKGLGNPDGIGYFENGSASIGLERGIILSTGPISYAASSNTAGDKSGDFGDKTNDPDLGKLAIGTIRDRVGLEFDFVPLDSFVTFRYVFASEEYCEFVGSKYNDVFGFFVRGPGIEGGFTGNAKNVALIPGSEDFVSINNVNHKKNKQHYIGNTRKRDAERCGIPYMPSVREEYIEYDGFTVKLTAMLKLNPCETYHIRLVVADVADNFYDSAVFLEAGSFDLGGQVSLRAVKAEEGPVSEGCSNAYFEFTRDQQQSADFPINVRFKLSESTTATPGVDFSALPSSMTIPVGQRSVKLPVEILNDELVEGIEKIAIELDIPCACYADAAELTISEPPELLLVMEDRAICPEQSIYLIPEVSGGNPAYTYLWGDASTSDRLLVNQAQDEPYFLTVTDACGHQKSISAKVVPSVPPRATIAGREEICTGDTARIKIDFTGIAPWNFDYSLDGELMPEKENIYTNPYYLPVTRAGDYELEYFADAGCAGEVQGIASVTVLQMEISLQTESVRCAGGSDGNIQVDLPMDFPPYTYSWDEVPDTSLTLNGLSTGIYTFRVSDGRGCSQSLAVQIEEPLPLQFPAVDCEQVRSGSWLPSAIGGSPPYHYQWAGNRLDAAALLQQLEPGSFYPIEIEDANGCRTLDTLLAPMLTDKMVELPPQINLVLGTEYQLEPILHIPSALLAGVMWLPSGNLSCDDCLDPFMLDLQEGTYTIRVIDRFGCMDEAETLIVLNTDYPIFVPNVFSPNGDDQNDRFGILASSAVVDKIINLTIYNRWGSRIFQGQNLSAQDTNAGWDGMAGHQPAPIGIYVYYIEVELTNGERKVLTGDVLLVR